MAKDTYSIHKVFRIVEPNAGGGQDERDVEINIPIYDSFNEEIGRYNDYATSKYDLRIIPGSSLPLNRWAVLEEYKEWFQLGLIDDIAFLQHTDITNKEALMERKSELSQTKKAIEERDEVISDRDGTIETLSRQIIQMGIRDEIRSAGTEIDRSKTETKMANKLSQMRMSDILKMAQKQITDEIKNEKEKKKPKKSEKK